MTSTRQTPPWFRWIALGLLLLVPLLTTQGCRARHDPAREESTGLHSSPEARPTLSAHLQVPTFTPTPEATPTSIPTATSPPALLPLSSTTTPIPRPQVQVNANLRGGPGTNYAIKGGLSAGDEITVVARTADGSWLLLQNGSWLYVDLAVYLPDNLPRAQVIPPTPIPREVAPLDNPGTVPTSYLSGAEVLAGHVDVIAVLLAHGADIEARDSRSDTPLLKAAALNRVEATKVLLAHNANPNATGYEGQSALHVAVYSHIGTDVMALLLDHSRTNPNVRDDDGYTALHRSMEDSLLKFMYLLLRHPDINPNVQNREEKFAALHLATIRGIVDAVEALLEHPDTDPNVQTASGWTPLHFAIRDDQLRVLGTLLDHPDTNPTKRERKGWTPLHLAVYHGKLDMVEELLNHRKIKINLVNDNNLSPLGLAVMEGRSKIADLLFEHGGTGPFG